MPVQYAPYGQVAAPETVDGGDVFSIVLIILSSVVVPALLRESGAWALWLPLVAGCAVFVYADARKNGIRKNHQLNNVRGAPELLNMAPVGWMWLVFLFAVVGLPCYFASRGRLRTRQGGDGFFVVAVLASVVLLFGIVVTIVFGTTSRSAGMEPAIPTANPSPPAVPHAEIGRAAASPASCNILPGLCTARLHVQPGSQADCREKDNSDVTVTTNLDGRAHRLDDGEVCTERVDGCHLVITCGLGDVRGVSDWLFQDMSMGPGIATSHFSGTASLSEGGRTLCRYEQTVECLHMKRPKP
jgi:hypothetical protein